MQDLENERVQEAISELDELIRLARTVGFSTTTAFRKEANANVYEVQNGR